MFLDLLSFLAPTSPKTCLRLTTKVSDVTFISPSPLHQHRPHGHQARQGGRPGPHHRLGPSGRRPGTQRKAQDRQQQGGG